MIPKLIHAVWFGEKPIPADQLKYIESWKKKLPDYQIKIWRDKDLEGLGNNVEFVKFCKEKKKYGFIADWYRLYLVHEYGGIYLDTDVKVYKSFNDILTSRFFLSFIVDSSLQIAVFGAEKGNSVVSDMLSFLERDFAESKTLRVSNEWVTKYFLDNFPDFKLNGLEQHLEAGIDIYPKTYFDTYPSIFDFSGKGGYSVHFCAGSWLKKENGEPVNTKQKITRFIKKVTPPFIIHQRNYLSHVEQVKNYPYYNVYLQTTSKDEK